MSTRTTMGGKRVFTVPSKTVINFKSGFGKKLLCDDLTFTTGTACQYSCSFCYVPSAMRKQKDWLSANGVEGEHEDIVIRRGNALEILRQQLTIKGKPRFSDPNDQRVIYASPLVDVAANMELVNETAEACKSILSLTNWHIRLLSKSHLLPKIAEQLDGYCMSGKAGSRVIYGVSTGTLDDKVAAVFERGTPLVSKRIQSLHWLQENGFRTFAMVCPSLPFETIQEYRRFAKDCSELLRYDICEHVWAEVINVRGDSMTRTIDELRKGGLEHEATLLQEVTDDKEKWENYSRVTFMQHWNNCPNGKLRFLQYVNNDNVDFWKRYESYGAVLL